jgi:hypothetical protein
MSIITASIPVPTTGEGALVDVSTMVGPKTVVFSGQFQGIYELLGSHDDSHFVPILQFDAGGVEGVGQTISGSFKSMRLRAATPATSPGSGVTCEVSAVAGVGQNYFAQVASLAAGAAPGLTPVIDLAPLYPPTGPEEDICFLCEGGLQGQLVVLGSLDGVYFCPVGSYRRDRVPEGAPISAEFSVLPSPDKVRYVRLSLDGTAADTITVTVGGRVLPTVVTPPVVAAWWPLDEIAYFFLDGDNGSDANVGYIVAPAGTVFTPAQAAAVAIKTTDRLEEIIPPCGAGRRYVILAKPRAGRAMYDAAVPGDGVGSFRRDLRSGYSQEIMRGSDLTNSPADRAQLGMVTAFGPFTVASVAPGPNGWKITLTAPVGIPPNTLGKYRMRTISLAGTQYAACRWGDIAVVPNPNVIYTRVNSFGPLAPGDTLWLEEPGVRIYNYVEGVLDSVLPAGLVQSPRLQLAGVEVGNNDTGIDGIVRLGANTPGEFGTTSAPPVYCCVRSDTAIVVGSMKACGQFYDETGYLALTAGMGVDFTGGITSSPAVDSFEAVDSYLDNSTTLTASYISILNSLVLLCYVIRGEKGIQLTNIDYEQIFVQPRSLCTIEIVRWIPSIHTLIGIMVLPDAGSLASIRIRNARIFYGPEPALPGITLYYGQYTVLLDLDTSLTLGTGVMVRHDANSGAPQTLVTYASLAVTGFEVEGAQKVICTRSGLGYPSNVLPCPRGIVMQMVDGVAGTAHPVGLVATAPAATPARFDLALSDDSANMRVIGATLTNLVQGDGSAPDGWAVVGYDGLMVLRQEVGSTNPVSGDNLYLSEVDAGHVSKDPPDISTSYMRLGRASPIGPNATTSGVVVPTAWEPEQPVIS